MNWILPKSTYLVVAFILSLGSVQGQSILDKQDAVTIALENNFDIRTADNNVAIARNNADIKNSNYLPTVGATGNANFAITDAKLTFQDGSVRETTGAQTERYNGSIVVSYTLFNGFARENIYRSLKENYNISELQARQVIETSLVTIFSGYYEVARLTENEINQRQTRNIF